MSDQINKLIEDHSEIKKDVALLKQASENTLKAVESLAVSQSDLNGGLAELVSAMNEGRIRGEERDKHKDLQYELLQTQLHQNAIDFNEARDKFRSEYEKPIERLKVSQGRWDKVINSMFGSTGKSVWLLIVLAAMYFLGITPSDFTGK